MNMVVYYVCNNSYFFFFFQAEDGIRDVAVTGVQTCALPIYEGGGGAAKLRKIDGAEKADRHAHEHRQHKQLSAADNGVGHTTAGFAHRGGQLGKEAPAHGSPAVDDQVTEDQEKHGDVHPGENTGHR